MGQSRWLDGGERVIIREAVKYADMSARPRDAWGIHDVTETRRHDMDASFLL